MGRAKWQGKNIGQKITIFILKRLKKYLPLWILHQHMEKKAYALSYGSLFLKIKNTT